MTYGFAILSIACGVLSATLGLLGIFPTAVAAGSTAVLLGTVAELMGQNDREFEALRRISLPEEGACLRALRSEDRTDSS